MSNLHGALGPQQRADALAQLAAREFDVVVLGAGVVGAGAALDAATRGLSVALVEARDYASGTSSRSSKLVHGGLRYLEQLEFGLVREALRERSLILNTLAPHLARPVPFLYPLQHRGWERLYVGAGVALYDVLGGRHGVPTHKHLSRGAARRLFPALRKDSLVGAIRYYDGQLDDARHTMMLARTARHYGAVCAPSTRVTGFRREGDRVTGVVVTDLEGGAESQVRAKQTINATGVWTDELQQLVGGRGQLSVRASKGIHLVVPRDRINATVGLISRTEKSVLFVIPWVDHWIIGTTDSDWNLDLAHPAASRSDIDYLLDQANRLLTTPLTHQDIQGVYAGLRPLLQGESDTTSKLSREHAVVTPVAGLTMIAGGKYTTYRVMAKDAVDAALHSVGPAAPSSVSHRIPLVGAEGYPALWNARQRLADESGIHVARVEHLLHRYGSLVHELLRLVVEDPELGKPLAGAPDYLRVELRYGASHEGALHLDDLLARRTRISIETFDRGLSAAPEVARIVAPVLGWTEADIAREVEHYAARVEAERESQQQPDDHTADAARLGAPDVRTGSLLRHG
ncbi:glycerol-3-phosphate dehydrogenase [Phycicoccus badiiscoriae]|uniref:glycerol-3-phosphate dehydrogenase n=1 Tax=Pedococcus badiiscoriae TaxID=642776 RepID=A0A852WTS3_9MICO|nr:glycerol-3-phosphate dehydrogenase/oxidase [Pedococcus badiiscoriae]NYG08646.1 glycerol-3-phosphate dehydrogenase [Pedococcus badiiscoriae]